MSTRNRTLTLTLTASLALAATSLTGCSSESDPVEAAAGTAAPTATRAVMLTSAPADALDVAAAKTTVSEGDTITIRGRIGGSRSPMTGESGIFLMMDPALEPCAPDEGCPTPWDYCCETPDSKSANNATVQLVGADGTALAADFAALGLEPMDEVIVVGTVGPRPDERVLLVRATGVHKIAGG